MCNILQLQSRRFRLLKLPSPRHLQLHSRGFRLLKLPLPRRRQHLLLSHKQKNALTKPMTHGHEGTEPYSAHPFASRYSITTTPVTQPCILRTALLPICSCNPLQPCHPSSRFFLDLALHRCMHQARSACSSRVQLSLWAYTQLIPAPGRQPSTQSKHIRQLLLVSGCRPRYYWENDVNIRMELEPHVTAVQHNPDNTPTRYLPTRKTLLQAGLTALATAVGTRGGMYSAHITKLMNAKVIPR